MEWLSSCFHSLQQTATQVFRSSWEWTIWSQEHGSQRYVEVMFYSFCSPFDCIDWANSDWTLTSLILVFRAMMMTACDLNGTTKPWEIQKGVSTRIASSERLVVIGVQMTPSKYIVALEPDVTSFRWPLNKMAVFSFFFVNLQVVNLVTREFFEQGDLERERLNVEPLVSKIIMIRIRINILFI